MEFIIIKVTTDYRMNNKKSHKTNFVWRKMGLIQQGIRTSLKHLSICEFMELIKFEKNNVMTDYFWQVMVEKRCIHLDTPLMKCLGYEEK